MGNLAYVKRLTTPRWPSASSRNSPREASTLLSKHPILYQVPDDWARRAALLGSFFICGAHVSSYVPSRLIGWRKIFRGDPVIDNGARIVRLQHASLQN